MADAALMKKNADLAIKVEDLEMMNGQPRSAI
jgi:hypothetical protein